MPTTDLVFAPARVIAHLTEVLEQHGPFEGARLWHGLHAGARRYVRNLDAWYEAVAELSTPGLRDALLRHLSVGDPLLPVLALVPALWDEQGRDGLLAHPDPAVRRRVVHTAGSTARPGLVGTDFGAQPEGPSACALVAALAHEAHRGVLAVLVARTPVPAARRAAWAAQVVTALAPTGPDYAWTPPGGIEAGARSMIQPQGCARDLGLLDFHRALLHRDDLDAAAFQQLLDLAGSMAVRLLQDRPTPWGSVAARLWACYAPGAPWPPGAVPWPSVRERHDAWLTLLGAMARDPAVPADLAADALLRLVAALGDPGLAVDGTRLDPVLASPRRLAAVSTPDRARLLAALPRPQRLVTLATLSGAPPTRESGHGGSRGR